MSSGRLTPQSIGIEYQPTPRDETEMTLAFILLDLEAMSNQRFTLEQEDQLMAIEMKARELRSKLS